MKKSYATLLFLVMLAGVSFYYKYNEIVFKRPQSIHKWRQSDCASIALNYYQGGMHFFQPETNNLTSDGGTTGKCCTSEVPILYYSAACLYKVFGYHDYVFRFFNTLLFFTGLFFLFKLLYYVLKDVFWSIAITLLLFTSPVLVFYGNNFLSNSSALAFSIIAWYYLVRFLFEKEQKLFYISVCCFFIAGAFKITALFSLVSVCGIFLLELFNISTLAKNEKLFKSPVRVIIPILIVFIVLGFWIKYAHDYNQKHDCSYFSTTIFPIWDLDKQGVKDVLLSIKNNWLDQYFHKTVLLFLVAAFLFLVFSFKKNNPFLLYAMLFIFAEEIIYVLFQFWTFADHDYYTIEMYILPVLVFIGLLEVLKRQYPKVLNSIVSKTVFTLFLLFNIYYAQAKLNERYNSWMNDYPQNKDLYEITPYLKEIGINPMDTVISIPDASHASLYLMNLKGWTEYTDAHFNKGLPTYYNQDSAGIQQSINKGAKYVIVNGIDELSKKKYLQYYCKNLIGRFNGVLIFRLGTQVVNFNMQVHKVKNKFICSAETLTKDGRFYLNETDSTLFEYGVTQSDKFAHQGKYSCKVDAQSPYGMTIKLKALEEGETFAIAVWRKINTGKVKGDLIASSANYYNNQYKIAVADSNGWEKIYKEFSISPELVNKELVIYVYNPEKETVYFDDLEIIRYEGLFNNLSSKNSFH